MNKKLFLTLTTFLAISALPITVYANSSWYWISNSRPWDILPIVAVATVIIEVFIINKFGKVNKLYKTAFAVIIANLLSFAMPYILRCFNELYDFEQMINNTPSYTVTAVFLLMTLIIEMPFVYFSLQKSSDNQKHLILSILSSNVATTILVAATERIICKGTW